MRALRLTILAAVSSLALSACMFGGTPSAEVGECLNVSELGAEVTDLPKIDCADPHEAEVYDVFDLEYDGNYDATAINTELEEQCMTSFETFVGTDYWESELDIFFFAPTPDGWDGGDREVICAVIAPDWETGEMTLVTGSFEGSQR